MAVYEKPLPLPTPDTKPYWDFARKHELRMQKCGNCGHIRWPAGMFCPECYSDKYEWVKLSGRGTVYTFGVNHQPWTKAFAPDLPYIVAVIELAEGPHMLSNITGISPKDVKIGMPVEVYFDDITEEFALPKFKPAK